MKSYNWLSFCRKLIMFPDYGVNSKDSYCDLGWFIFSSSVGFDLYQENYRYEISNKLAAGYLMHNKTWD